MASFDFEIKRGDTLPRFDCTLLDAAGVAVDLTNATSAFLFVKSLTAVKVNAQMTIHDQTTDRGRVSYAWQAADTDTAGSYKAEIQVNWLDGNIQSFPTEKQLKLSVQADLA